MLVYIGIFIGGFFMKNKFLLMAMGMLIFFASCRTTEVNWENSGTFGQHYIVTAKDWEPVSLVFTEVEFQITNRFQINGEVFTYQELLKEAQKLNADAIINVTIDKRVDTVSSGMASVIRQRWYGSALAIKFTHTLETTTDTHTLTTTDRRDETRDTTVVNPIIHSTGTASPVYVGGEASTDSDSGRSGLFSGLFHR